jgi:NADH-quinone oxidoreductase subunit E
MSVLSDRVRERIRAEFPKYPNLQAVTLPALHIVQEELGCVSLQSMREIAELLELHPAEVHDTMSFYGFFRDESNPLGKYRVWVCRSLSCGLRGGEELLDGLQETLKCPIGSTSADGKYSLELAECLGVCEGAPCMLVQDECIPNLTVESATRFLESLDSSNGQVGAQRGDQ